MKPGIITLLIAVQTLFAWHLNAQQIIEVNLWTDGLPNTNGIDHLPFDDETRNFNPSFKLFLPDADKATGRIVLALPGGGYGGLATEHEGYQWAPFFNEQGIALAVLKYRMPHGNREVPFSDVEEALRIIKANAAQWNINPDDVGIMGSSAGGHLASTVATKLRNENRPAFQILFYPVITMDTTFTHMGSRNNLLGKDVTPEIEELYSNEKQITPDTPRAIILFSDDDGAVPPANGAQYYLGLKKHNIPASLYIYPSGGHGWGIRDNFKYHDEMIANLRSWLASF